MNTNTKSGIVYEIKHLPTNKKYIGSTTQYKAEDLLVNYFTSSKIVQDLIEIDGVEEFRILNIEYSDDSLALETWMLEQIDAKNNDDYINQHNNWMVEGFRKYLELYGGHSDESKQKISAAMQGEKHPNFGKNHSDETKMKISANNAKHWGGKTLSEETKMKMSAAMQGKPQPKTTCPHCNKVGSVSNMKRWHFDNCNHKQEFLDKKVA